MTHTPATKKPTEKPKSRFFLILELLKPISVIFKAFADIVKTLF